MAKIKDGITGGISGKIGNIIGANWKGKNYIRIKPAHHHDLKSEKQIAQRLKFELISSFTREFGNLIKNESWGKYAKKMTAKNLFIKTNIKAIENDGSICDFSKLKLSIGNIFLPKEIKVQQDSKKTQNIDISWKDAEDLKITRTNDWVNIIILNKERWNARPSFFLRCCRRSENHISIYLRNIEEYEKIEIYIYFYDEELNKYSESMHTGLLIKQNPSSS